MLAIIIPYYKFTFFEATLESLANQTDKRFKVYIGDDASRECPSQLLEECKDKFDFIYYRFENNLGGESLTKQWKRCIDLSKNEDWIMILGDDDVVGENVVEAFYDNLPEIKRIGTNVVKYASQTNDISKNIFSKIHYHSKLEDAAAFYYNRFKGQVRSSLSEHVFKREVYLKHGFKNYPLAWHSDDYAWLAFAEEKPMYCINEAVVTIKISSGSITGNNQNLVRKNVAEALFFTDLIQTQIHLFLKTQRLELLYQAEVSLKKNNKLSYSQWVILAKGYVCNFSLIPIAKFIRRIVMQSIK